MLLAAGSPNENKAALLTIDKDIEIGTKIS